MTQTYSKQKNYSSYHKKSAPTLKIKNITFCREYTKNIDQQLINFHLRMGRNMSHKFFDCKNKNKENPLDFINNQPVQKKSTITDIFSIKAMNLNASSKIFLPVRLFSDQTNMPAQQILQLQKTIKSQSGQKLKRNSENYERSKNKKAKTITDQTKRQSSCSPGSRNQRRNTQKYPQVLLNRQRKLILTTNDKVFDLNFANYCEFLYSAANLHQIQINFEDYAKPCTVIVGRGNNSKLVKDVLKKRWWMKVQDRKGSQPINFTQTNLIWTQTKVNQFYSTELESGRRLHNHFEFNGNLGNKKQLFLNMKRYYLEQKKDPFDVLPLTFNVRSVDDQDFRQFGSQFHLEKEKNPSKKQLWIVKPGQNSNRGRGITIHSELSQIQKLVNQENSQNDRTSKGQYHTFIIQKYIQKPFLYQKRKFDIRCYYLLVSINNKIKAYWYKEGYIRTSCFQFNCNEESKENLFVHLTNDAVQKNHENYGKYEDGNKIDFSTFKKYVASKYPARRLDFDTQIYEKIKSIAQDSIKATYKKLKGSTKPMFEIFGLDFMIDEDFKPWLIEVNTNPCLQTTCMVLERIIPKMVDDAFQLSVDLMYPPPKTWPSSRKHLIPNHLQSGFDLIFDQNQAENIQDEIKQQDYYDQK